MKFSFFSDFQINLEKELILSENQKNLHISLLSFNMYFKAICDTIVVSYLTTCTNSCNEGCYVT